VEVNTVDKITYKYENIIEDVSIIQGGLKYSITLKENIE
jgi:hypothetical protein